MDHSKMDHSSHSMSGMDHSMPGMDPDMDMCSMNMIFTWDWKNLCVIFKWWHVRSFSSFVFSMFAIAALAAGYEYFRAKVKKLDSRINSSIRLPTDQEEPSLTSLKSGAISKIQKSILYGVLVGYSYMIMLVFMTYNGWVMLSVVVGAIIGNFFFGSELNETMACH